MSISRQIGTLLFILGAAVLIIGSGSVIARFQGSEIYGPQSYSSASVFAQKMIVYVSVAAAVLVCALGGYFLLQAVHRSRLCAGRAVVWFLGLAIVSELISPLLMVISQAFWPNVLRGEVGGWMFLDVLMVTLLFLFCLLIMFLIGLGICGQSDAKSGA